MALKLVELYRHNNSSLNLTFAVDGLVESENFESYSSKKYIVGGMVSYQFQAESGNAKITLSEEFDMINGKNVDLKITTKYTGYFVTMDYYKLNFNRDYRKCSKLLYFYSQYDVLEEEVTSETIILDDKRWHSKCMLMITKNRQKPILMKLIIDVVVNLPSSHITPTPFHGLYDDTIFTDFELCGEDGSIHAHKAVLASCSPVLKTMLSGQWKETSKGKVELPGVTAETMTDLKAYIYLHKLPDEDDKDKLFIRFEELLKLACYLMMPDLIEFCSARFLLDLTKENVYKLMSLSFMYKLKILMDGIVLSINEGPISSITLPDDWK